MKRGRRGGDARSWPRRIATAAGLVLLSSLIGLLLGELLFRWLEPPPILTDDLRSDRRQEDAALYAPAPPPLGYEPVAGRSAGPGRMNALGLRDREGYARDKPQGTYRVVMLGDSVTWGAGIPQAETFENLLEDRLEAEGRKVEIMNLGVPGYNALMMAAFLERRGLPLQPDLVLAVVGLNDQASTPAVLWEPEQARFRFFDSSGQDRVPWVFDLPLGLDRWLMTNSALFRGLCRRLAAPDTPVYDRLRTENREALLHIDELARGAGGRAAVVLLPELSSFAPYAKQAEHDELKAFLQGRGRTVIDLLPGLARLTDGNGESLRYHAEDAIHPDRAAQDLIAQLLHEGLVGKRLIP